jgi:hypothetical protein
MLRARPMASHCLHGCERPNLVELSLSRQYAEERRARRWRVSLAIAGASCAGMGIILAGVITRGWLLGTV